MHKRGIIVGLFVAAVLVGGAGVAVAGVSDGNYDPERQGCSGNANDHDGTQNGAAEEGCQNATVNVRDGEDREAGRAGLKQTAEGEWVDPTDPSAEADPDSGFDPSTATRVYVGADDNLNGGEHDGSSQVGDGPSDGGAIVLNLEPASVDAWLAALQAGDTQYLATHPLPLIDFGAGACADGVCFAIQTQRRTAYDGGNPDAAPRDAANYEGHNWDPEGCSGVDSEPTADQCGEGTDLGYWHDQYGDAYVEPGVQVYEDPSPAGSPLGPYPAPSVYVGTCGVIAGGGPAEAPASPVTNGAGQVVISTTC